MKLNHAKRIVQEPNYVEACRVIAEAEAGSEETVAEKLDELIEDQDGDTEEIVEEN